MSSLTPVSSRRLVLLWRLHVWAAVLLSPLIVLVTLTGLLYVFAPAIDEARYGYLQQVSVPAAGARLPLTQQLQAAAPAIPADWRLHSLILPQAAPDTLQLLYRPPAHEHAGHGGHRPGNGLWLYIDPWRGTLLGQRPEQHGFSLWVRQLHASLLLGPYGRWLSELAASWLLLLLLSGLYMVWLRRKQLLRRPPGGRSVWLVAHWLPGTALALLTLVMVSTGITWSALAGNNVRWLRDISGQAPPRPPADLRSRDGTPLTVSEVVERARGLHPQLRLQLQAPAGAHGTWKISSAERARPTLQFERRLDAVSGATLFYAGWEQQTAFSRATAIGIPFHRGELGWWNQALLLLFGVSVLVSVITGWRLLLGRRLAGGPWLPRLLPGTASALSPRLLATALVLVLLLPLVAVSAVLLAALEYRLYCQRRAKSA